jgi:hypothetical protein
MLRAIVCAFVFLAPPAFAQAAPLDGIYACAGIPDRAARLTCFDVAVASLKKADAAGGVAVVDRTQIEKAEKEAFGLVAPSLTAIAESARASSSTPGAGPASVQRSKGLEKVTFPVRSIVKGPDGRYRFTMENGQVWRQTDGITLPAIGKGPWQAEIRKAAIGSFMLKLDDRTSVRVKRAE